MAYVLLMASMMFFSQWMAWVTRYQIPVDSWAVRLFAFGINYGFLPLLCCVPVLGMLGWLPGTRRRLGKGDSRAQQDGET